MARISIIGATGVLGKTATNYFLQKEFSVTAFVRDPKKAVDLENAGAQLVVGDLTDTTSLAKAVSNADIVITAAHGMLGKGKNKSENIDGVGHKALIDAAKNNGVRQFIFSSVIEPSRDHPIDFWRTKFETEQYLQASGLSYTILRLAAFMEWHVHRLLGQSIQKKGKTTIFGTGDNPTNFIAVQDVVQTLGIVAGNEAYYNKIVTVAGPENLSRNEVAMRYGHHLKITPRTGHVPVGVLRVLAGVIGPFHPGIARIMKLGVYADKMDATLNTNNSIRQFGLQPTSVDDFIKKQLNEAAY